MFKAMNWQSDRMVLNDLMFRLEHFRSDDWDGGDHFRFYKIKPLVDLYETFFNRRKDYSPRHIIELGIYDGGSTAFWFELFKPEKHIALDLSDRDDSEYFKQWVATRSLQDRVKTHWRADQANKPQLKQFVNDELGGWLDLVIDDASHLYGPSKASFEALFPYCRPGGLYIIEDWAWDHWEGFTDPKHAWAHEQRLTQLVIELVEAAGTSSGLISNIEVFQGFIVVERGLQELDPNIDFKLDEHIVRRPVRSLQPAIVGQTSKLQRLRGYIARRMRG